MKVHYIEEVLLHKKERNRYFEAEMNFRPNLASQFETVLTSALQESFAKKLKFSRRKLALSSFYVVWSLCSETCYFVL